MIELFTIGFTKKKAKQFFGLLKSGAIQKIVDTRIRPNSQLAGFAKSDDLKYFAEELFGMKYEYELDFAPTKELLAKYRNKEISWKEYEVEYLNLLDIRKVKRKVDIEQLHKNCFLCSEHDAEKCHRRLLAEYFQAVNQDVKIVHLK